MYSEPQIVTSIEYADQRNGSYIELHLSVAVRLDRTISRTDVSMRMVRLSRTRPRGLGWHDAYIYLNVTITDDTVSTDCRAHLARMPYRPGRPPGHTGFRASSGQPAGAPAKYAA